MTEGKTYFKGINGLRALAALSVVVFHLNMSLKQYNLPLLRTIDLAGFGVTIFFAISGFLITYLLLKEQDTQPIDIKKFYIRRALRIWPLYFLFLGLSLLTTYIYNIAPLPGNLLYYIFFAANVPFIMDATLPFLGHYWSLGVEEQFYIFWPWLIRNKKNVLRTVIIFTVSYFCLRVIARFIDYKFGYPVPYIAIHVTRFECMSMGAIGAILLHQNNQFFMRFCTHILTQFSCWTVIGLLLFNKYHIASVLDQEIVSAVAVCLIINLSCNPKTIVRMDYPIFDFLGKISYGIYVMHQLVIFYFARLLYHFELQPGIKYPLVYIGVIGITIGLAYLSYEYFEKRFLVLKEKFSVVKSSTSPNGF